MSPFSLLRPLDGVAVRLREHPGKRMKLYAPEEYALKLAENDREEL